MKQVFSLLFVFSACRAFAQADPAGIVHAEKNFAAAARANGTRDAFLAYLDSSADMFEKGRFVNGIQSWQARPKRPGLLAWYPQFAEIAASGDFGYTTGPWTFQASPADSVVARGQYNTVWHLTPSGWKFLVDIGNGYRDENEAPVVNKPIGTQVTRRGDTATAWWADELLTQSIRTNPDACQGFMSQTHSILNRAGHVPAMTKAAQQATRAGLPADLQLEPKGRGIAPSGDLAYVYGIATAGGKSEAYLHVWRREGSGWKLALDVLPF
ncbi:MAG: nuclear transport factor 2 family protein [Flaviaesturariibacter sp.]|nr:nuclear transport factor 2 family protein [Flaviaesturariibacter sp.]